MLTEGSGLFVMCIVLSESKLLAYTLESLTIICLGKKEPESSRLVNSSSSSGTGIVAALDGINSGPVSVACFKSV